MTLKLNRLPNQSYSIAIDGDARSLPARGRLPRSRLDQINSASTASISHVLSPDEFDSFMAFYDRLKFTNEEFKADLITGDFALREHNCRLIPGSLRMQGMGGPRVEVSYDVEADFLDQVYTIDFDEMFLSLYEANGDRSSEIFPLLAKLANEDLPS